jgi:hypothetical protein
MGFSFSSKKVQEVPTQVETIQEVSTQSNSSQLQLNKSEVEALLIMIKESTFKGDQVEHVYNLVFKLQEYYKSLTN